jgi:hypothetical protein
MGRLFEAAETARRARGRCHTLPRWPRRSTRDATMLASEWSLNVETLLVLLKSRLSSCQACVHVVDLIRSAAVWWPKYHVI